MRGAALPASPVNHAEKLLVYLLPLTPMLLLALTCNCSASDGMQMVAVAGAAAGSSGAAGAPVVANSGGAPSGGASGADTAGAANAGAPSLAGASGMQSASAGAGGTAGSSGATSGGGMSGAGGAPVMGHVATGMSAGCNTAPPSNDSSKNFIAHDVSINGLNAVYLAGGMYAQTSGNYTLALRPYAVKLPTNYDATKAYAVSFGGGGCGSGAAAFAASPGGNFSYAPNGLTIQVGLNSMTGCFNDGGPSIGNRTDSPEEPYFRAVVADLEAHYCIDKSKLFMAGYSSGGWEAYTLGCAASDLLRGIGADEGGMRSMHPTCKGPVAAVLVAGEADTENPIGPLDPNNASDKIAIGRLGSLGSAPGRDDILMRNGCSGSTSAPYTGSAGKYPQCMQYTQCPAAYPVIWCGLPGVGHNSSTYGGASYSPGPMWDVLSALSAP